MNETICDTKAHAEKYDRMRQRGFLTEDGKINVMVFACTENERVTFDLLMFSDLLPKASLRV